MSDTKSDEQAIRDVIQRWMEATTRGDTATVLDLMTDDVVFLAPGREPFGKEVFRLASEATKGMKIEGQNDVEEINILGDHGYVRSRITVKVTMPDGKVVDRAGYGLAIFRKEASGWKLARDANLVTLTKPSSG